MAHETINHFCGDLSQNWSKVPRTRWRYESQQKLRTDFGAEFSGEVDVAQGPDTDLDLDPVFRIRLTIQIWTSYLQSISNSSNINYTLTSVYH